MKTETEEEEKGWCLGYPRHTQSCLLTCHYGVLMSRNKRSDVCVAERGCHVGGGGEKEEDKIGRTWSRVEPPGGQSGGGEVEGVEGEGSKGGGFMVW